MQDTFCAPGAPAEVPPARDIVDDINRLTGGLRLMAVPIIWVLHGNSQVAGGSDWELFFNHVVADDVRERTLESLARDGRESRSGLQVAPEDLQIVKNRYSALIAGSSGLERILRSSNT